MIYRSTSINTMKVFMLVLLIAIVYPITFEYNDPRFRYLGRYYTDQEGLKYDWPCFSINFCFINVTRIIWLNNDRFGHYNVQINSTNKIVIPGHSTKITIYD
jgi:hypothetical protein